MKNYLVLALLIMGVIGCSKKESKSIQALQKISGIPVTVQKIEQEFFSKKILFSSTLIAYRQTSKYSPIASEVSKINFQEGDYVSKGEVVIQYPKDNASSNFLQAQSAFQNSKKSFDRMQKIYKKGGIAKQTLDNVQTKYEVDKANFDAASKSIAIVSPMDGYITSINVSLTENVDKEQALFTVSNLSKIKAKLLASEDQILQMKIGQKVIAFWRNIKIEGVLTNIAVSMDQKSKSFVCYAEFDNRDRKILSGVMADIYVEIYKNSKAITVPTKLVVDDKKGQFVYVVKELSAQKCYIETKNENKTSLEITSGLEVGDLLIIKGNNTVYQGVKVEITN